VKYIIYQMDDFQIPITFPEHVVHKMVSVRFFPPMSGHSVKPIAAGFYTVDSAMQVTCSGKSESMGLKSRGVVDAKLIKDHLLTGMPIHYQTT
jgi:hypothetical protein